MRRPNRFTVISCISAILFASMWRETLTAVAPPQQVAAAGARGTSADERVTYFEKHIRPLLVERCLECHSQTSESVGGNLMLDRRAGWMSGGDLGPAIIAGDPDSSLLLRAVRHTADDLQMPPDGRLSVEELGHLERWIRQGAVDPRDLPLTDTPSRPAIDLEAGRQHWAFRPLRQTALPELSAESLRWAEGNLDLWIARSHQRRGVTPVPRGDRRTLIRRATYDLCGVPPEPSEIERFLNDSSPQAYRRLIDRLLASPQYGERWGRHWLDVARYADSNGLDENAAHGNAWRYRDYVIAAFNSDLDYATMIAEQLAGDQWDSSDPAVRRRRTVATGFLVLGPKVLAEGDETKMEMDIIDEQIETVGRAFLGLTLGCARCHDHKFDPIRTDDYYALAGIFGSTKTMESFKRIAKWNEVSVATDAERQAIDRRQKSIDATKQKIDSVVREANARLVEADAEHKLPPKPETLYSVETQNALSRLREELADAEASRGTLPMAMAVVDRDSPKDQAVLIRGSHLSPANRVPRGFPAVLVSHRSHQQHSIPSNQSGRLQLARWLTDSQQALVARVMVNRIWRWHFGRGLVPTTDNFGLLGQTPTHPELLDWLAGRFIADGWSIKKLHRRIMLTATYQLSSSASEANELTDATNETLWRFRLRRLEAEELLDSMHAVSGLLDSEMGGSLLQTENRVLVFNHTSEDNTTYEQPRRAVYLPVIRNHLADAFQLFDYSEASVMTSDRPTTTVAPQALFMMNSALVLRASAAFADRLLGDPDQSDRQRIDNAYVHAFGRPPRPHELARALDYLARFESESSDNKESRRQAWRLLCQTLLSANEFCHLR